MPSVVKLSVVLLSVAKVSEVILGAVALSQFFTDKLIFVYNQYTITK